MIGVLRAQPWPQGDMMRIAALSLGIAALLAACDGQAGREDTSPAPEIRFQRASADEVAHGERLSRVLGCSGCHGANLQGEEWSEPGFGTLWTSNLTRAAPKYSDEQLAGVITSGARPDGSELWEMPSHLFTHLASEDMAALVSYIRSMPPAGEIHPAPKFEEGARKEIAAGIFKPSTAQVQTEGKQWPPAAGEQHQLARYIVRATCAECHGMNLEGGQPNPSATPRPDLRMVAAYEPADFQRLMKTGIAAGGREVSLMSEVARGRYRHFTDDEIVALYGYLQAVGTNP